MKLKDYNTKTIIWTDKDLMLNKNLYIDIEDTQYVFKVFYVKEAIIEIGVFIKYSSLERGTGPIERNIMDKITTNIYDYQGFFRRYKTNPAFIIDTDVYELRQAGAGPVALRLLMDFSYSELDNPTRPIEKMLRNLIVYTYEMEIEGNPEKEKRLERILKKAEKDNQRKEELVRKTREKEKRMRELEDDLDLFKPVDKSRYKMR
ncbi:MAG: hypothetical protein IKV87_01245 [Methanobrevibacter sp.]|nr:hypothetical protein [Methanobrevibacter sp.]